MKNQEVVKHDNFPRIRKLDKDDFIKMMARLDLDPDVNTRFKKEFMDDCCRITALIFRNGKYREAMSITFIKNEYEMLLRFYGYNLERNTEEAIRVKNIIRQTIIERFSRYYDDCYKYFIDKFKTEAKQMVASVESMKGFMQSVDLLDNNDKGFTNAFELLSNETFLYEYVLKRVKDEFADLEPRLIPEDEILNLNYKHLFDI